MDKIEIGAVAKPQGIKGEIKIRLFSDNFFQVKDIKSVEIGDSLYKVLNFHAGGQDEAIMQIEGLTDRNGAELLRGKSVLAFKKELNNPEGRYFISDVIGCKIFLSSGKEIGEIYDIISGNVDYYYLNTTEGKAILPLIKDLSAKFDIENKKVEVNAKKFTEVIMYED